MLGQEGIAVLAVSKQYGELEYAIETTVSIGWWPVWGAGPVDGRRPTFVLDLSTGGRPVTLEWVKCSWRCVQPQCELDRDGSGDRDVRRRVDRAGLREPCRRVGRDGHLLAAVARNFGVGWVRRWPRCASTVSG
jgi:transposase